MSTNGAIIGQIQGTLKNSSSEGPISKGIIGTGDYNRGATGTLKEELESRKRKKGCVNSSCSN